MNATSPRAPTLPLTVPDVVCLDDVDAFAAETTSDLQTLAQDIYHLLLEIPGSNPDDPTRGIGIEELLSGSVDAAQKATGRVEQQLLQDDRIDHCSASLALQPDGSYLLSIQIQASGQVLGPSYSYTAASGLVPLS